MADSQCDSRSGNQRSTGKGRRRRAAAEQRMIEQRRMNELVDVDDEVDAFVSATSLSPSSSNSRRRNRRSLRRSLMRDSESYIYDYHPSNARSSNVPIDDLEIALAISLSLSESQFGNSPAGYTTSGSDVDMSYENLVALESVKVVANEEQVGSLPITMFGHSPDTCFSEELCTICQTEFVEGDPVMHLKCSHNFHQECGNEWLLKYSKLCPICKEDVMCHK